jgi:hypothetical protein
MLNPRQILAFAPWQDIRFRRSRLFDPPFAQLSLGLRHGNDGDHVMGRRAPPDDAKAAVRRRRRAADTARWRSRQRRGMALYTLEVGGLELDLAIRYGGLSENQLGNKTAINAALGKLLRLGLVALIEREHRRR